MTVERVVKECPVSAAVWFQLYCEDVLECAEGLALSERAIFGAAVRPEAVEIYCECVKADPDMRHQIQSSFEGLATIWNVAPPGPIDTAV